MRLWEIEIGMPVAYLPDYLLKIRQMNDDQLGIVTSKNDRYVFVRYKGSNSSQATNPDDLFNLRYRPDLMEKLGLEIKPINRVCQLYIEQKQTLTHDLP